MMKELSSAYTAMTGVTHSYMKDLGTNASDVMQTAEASAKEATGTLPTVEMFDLWNHGWRQWNAFAEQYVHSLQTGSCVGQESAAAESVAAGESPESVAGGAAKRAQRARSGVVT